MTMKKVSARKAWRLEIILAEEIVIKNAVFIDSSGRETVAIGSKEKPINLDSTI